MHRGAESARPTNAELLRSKGGADLAEVLCAGDLGGQAAQSQRADGETKGSVFLSQSKRGRSEDDGADGERNPVAAQEIDQAGDGLPEPGRRFA